MWFNQNKVNVTNFSLFIAYTHRRGVRNINTFVVLFVALVYEYNHKFYYYNLPKMSACIYFPV